MEVCGGFSDGAKDSLYIDAGAMIRMGADPGEIGSDCTAFVIAFYELKDADARKFTHH